MADEREPTQAMPSSDVRDQKPRPTQPTGEKKEPSPERDDEDFGGHMGTGGQSIIGYEGPEQSDSDDKAGDNPNAAADPD